MSFLKNGVDVSEWDYDIAWDKVKTDFVIIRLGFGVGNGIFKDKCFDANVAGCVKYNIPFAVYIYSYANSWDKLNGEAKGTLEQLAKLNKKPFAVFIDMEDKSTEESGKTVLTEFALEFCSQMKSAGYKPGVYANENWFRNHLDVSKIASAGNIIWCAKYSSTSPNIAANYDIWQYTSVGAAAGINGNVDLNRMYTDLFSEETEKKTVQQLAEEVLSGRWGNGTERKERLTEAGYDYYAVQDEVNRILGEKLDISTVAQQVINGFWGNGSERKVRLTEAGYDYYAVQAEVNRILGITK